MEFFIIDHNGQQAGPFSFDQLVQKGISPETLVWKQGMADWTPAWKVEDLRAVLEAIEGSHGGKQGSRKGGRIYRQQFLLAGAPLCSQDDGWQRDGRSDEPAFRIPQLYRLLYGFRGIQRKAAYREFRYPRQCLYDECRRYGEGAGICR